MLLKKEGLPFMTKELYKAIITRSRLKNIFIKLKPSIHGMLTKNKETFVCLL